MITRSIFTSRTRLYENSTPRYARFCHSHPYIPIHRAPFSSPHIFPLTSLLPLYPWQSWASPLFPIATSHTHLLPSCTHPHRLDAVTIGVWVVYQNRVHTRGLCKVCFSGVGAEGFRIESHLSSPPPTLWFLISLLCSLTDPLGVQGVMLLLCYVAGRMLRMWFGDNFTLPFLVNQPTLP